MLAAEAAPYFEVAPWMPLAAGLAITQFVFAVNLFGDALRDLLDPRLRGR
jgi:peptide/nickel transport system permease protein